jgi:hypothetical protein
MSGKVLADGDWVHVVDREKTPPKHSRVVMVLRAGIRPDFARRSHEGIDRARSEAAGGHCRSPSRSSWPDRRRAADDEGTHRTISGLPRAPTYPTPPVQICTSLHRAKPTTLRRSPHVRANAPDASSPTIIHSTQTPPHHQENLADRRPEPHAHRSSGPTIWHKYFFQLHLDRLHTVTNGV